jgi:uncharacterized protein YukE
MQDSLQHTLQQLQDQLVTLDGLAESEREQLEAEIREIQYSLDRFEIKSSDLAKRFHQSTERFSGNHPQLNQTAGHVVAVLSQLGI